MVNTQQSDMIMAVSDKRDVADVFRGRMKLLIAQRGDSLSGFAQSIGIDRSALSQFLAPNSTRLPRAETLHAISRQCGVSLDWLLGLVVENKDQEQTTAPIIEFESTGDAVAADHLQRWHREATGYKIRYVPSSIPDLFRTDAINAAEYGFEKSGRLARRERNASDQLTYSRRPETDMEVCMPLQTMAELATGEGLWKVLSAEERRDQLGYMIDLLDEMYPTFRLFLFDGRERKVSPYTVFGPKRAAIYLGELYLVINSVEHIKQLSGHFDSLIRLASVGPDRASAHLSQLRDAI